MQFDSSKYGPDIARVLALEENGQRIFPLVCGPCINDQARQALKGLKPGALFTRVKEPEAPMSGLWLYFSCFEEAHQLADSCETKEGELWHAILHRQEPDSGNSAYWFRKAGHHPMFVDLAVEAAKITARLPKAEFRAGKWDPYAFIAFCDR